MSENKRAEKKIIKEIDSAKKVIKNKDGMNHPLQTRGVGGELELIKKMENKKFGKPKKDFTDLVNNPNVKKWLKNLKGTTHRARLSILNRYCEFTKKNPTELITEHHQDTQRNPLEQEDLAKEQLKGFFDLLLTEKVDNDTARQYCYSKLAGFYKRNKVPVIFDRGEIPPELHRISTKKIWKKNGEMIKRADKKETLREIAGLFTARNRAILFTKISTGLDDIEAFNLTIGDFENWYFKEDNISYIDGSRPKDKVFFQAWLNSEACKAIEIYLKKREERGEELNKDTWLFVGDSKRGGKYTQMKPVNFYNDLRDTCKTLGIENITPKRLRDFYYSFSMENIKPEHKLIVERSMGHKINISGTHYEPIFNEIDSFKEIYLEYFEHKTLLFGGNGRITKVQEQITKLQQENAELREGFKLLDSFIRKHLPKAAKDLESQDLSWLAATQKPNH